MEPSAPPKDYPSKRIKSFLLDFLAIYPATGVFLNHRGLWEPWIPRTKLVLWYRFTDTELQIARIWHASQNRRKAPR